MTVLRSMQQHYLMVCFNIHICMKYFTSYYPSSAPSAAPTSLMVTDWNSSSITVQWEPVICTHRNGDITGYVVKYGTNESVQNITVNITSTTITGLTSDTLYMISVAATNINGTGPYSGKVVIKTSVKGKNIFH